jgi:putative endonuclease
MPVAKNSDLGHQGERIALEVLKEQGYRILEKNFRTRLGEIDIIARHKDTICFVEVKTRKSLTRGVPQESITPAKRHKLAQVALCYLKQKKLFSQKARFDVVAITRSAQGEVQSRLISNAFELGDHYSY